MSLDELMQAANELDETELERLLRRIVALRAQRTAHALPTDDVDLLDRMHPQIEQLGAQRLDALTTLAELRQVTLPTLMETLGVQIRAELTMQEAADLLHVSQSYLIQKIEVGEIPCRRDGHGQWIEFEELMAYGRRLEAVSSQALDEMVVLSEEMGLYV